MWISKKEYEYLKMKEKENIKAKENMIVEIKEMNDIFDFNSKKVKELYKTKKELKYYLDTNEEKGVVYIPKFIVEEMVYGL